jgi:D-tyrosyl-tRNA(Tyr) deacylase
VKKARVEVDWETVSEIGPGLLVLLGVAREDSEEDGAYLANKIAHLRLFADDQNLMNLSLMDTGGEVLVVSQFTLWGDCRKGRRPSFIRAAEPDKARMYYEHFMDALRSCGLSVRGGRFQAMMDVHLVNDGPVTLMLDSQKLF